MDYYKDKVVIVSGGASGIGRALCTALHSKNAIVISADINQQNNEASEPVNWDGKERRKTVRVDVSNSDEFQDLIEYTVEKYGRLDMIFNSAGIAIGGEARDLNLNHWRKILDVNLWGVIHGSTMAYAKMVKQGFGQIVNIASLAGLIGYPINTPYVASKAAVIGFSSSLRAEGAGLGVKVNVVCPGYVQTQFLDTITYLKADSQKVISKFPFKPMTPAKAAEVILKRVQRNQGLVVFPFYARLLWLFSRISQRFLTPINQKTVREFREIRASD